MEWPVANENRNWGISTRMMHQTLNFAVQLLPWLTRKGVTLSNDLTHSATNTRILCNSTASYIAGALMILFNATAAAPPCSSSRNHSNPSRITTQWQSNLGSCNQQSEHKPSISCSEHFSLWQERNHMYASIRYDQPAYVRLTDTRLYIYTP